MIAKRIDFQLILSVAESLKLNKGLNFQPLI
jgi:hypothetical protein